MSASSPKNRKVTEPFRALTAAEERRATDALLNTEPPPLGIEGVQRVAETLHLDLHPDDVAALALEFGIRDENTPIALVNFLSIVQVAKARHAASVKPEEDEKSQLRFGVAAAADHYKQRTRREHRQRRINDLKEKKLKELKAQERQNAAAAAAAELETLEASHESPRRRGSARSMASSESRDAFGEPTGPTLATIEIDPAELSETDSEESTDSAIQRPPSAKANKHDSSATFGRGVESQSGTLDVSGSPRTLDATAILEQSSRSIMGARGRVSFVLSPSELTAAIPDEDDGSNHPDELGGFVHSPTAVANAKRAKSPTALMRLAADIVSPSSGAGTRHTQSPRTASSIGSPRSVESANDADLQVAVHPKVIDSLLEDEFQLELNDELGGRYRGSAPSALRIKQQKERIEIEQQRECDQEYQKRKNLGQLEDVDDGYGGSLSARASFAGSPSNIRRPSGVALRRESTAAGKSGSSSRNLKLLRKSIFTAFATSTFGNSTESNTFSAKAKQQPQPVEKITPDALYQVLSQIDDLETDSDEGSDHESTDSDEAQQSKAKAVFGSIDDQLGYPRGGRNPTVPPHVSLARAMSMSLRSIGRNSVTSAVEDDRQTTVSRVSRGARSHVSAAQRTEISSKKTPSSSNSNHQQGTHTRRLLGVSAQRSQKSSAQPSRNIRGHGANFSEDGSSRTFETDGTSEDSVGAAERRRSHHISNLTSEQLEALAQHFEKEQVSIKQLANEIFEAKMAEKRKKDARLARLKARANGKTKAVLDGNGVVIVKDDPAFYTDQQRPHSAASVTPLKEYNRDVYCMSTAQVKHSYGGLAQRPQLYTREGDAHIYRAAARASSASLNRRIRDRRQILTRDHDTFLVEGGDVFAERLRMHQSKSEQARQQKLAQQRRLSNSQQHEQDSPSYTPGTITPIHHEAESPASISLSKESGGEFIPYDPSTTDLGGMLLGTSQKSTDGPQRPDHRNAARDAARVGNVVILPYHEDDDIASLHTEDDNEGSVDDSGDRRRSVSQKAAGNLRRHLSCVHGARDGKAERYHSHSRMEREEQKKGHNRIKDVSGIDTKTFDRLLRGDPLQSYVSRGVEAPRKSRRLREITKLAFAKMDEATRPKHKFLNQPTRGTTLRL